MSERDPKTGRFPSRDAPARAGHGPSADARLAGDAIAAELIAYVHDPRDAQRLYTEALQRALVKAEELGQVGLIAALAKAGAEIQGARAAELRVDPASAAGQYERMGVEEKRVWLLERRAWCDAELAALPAVAELPEGER